MSQQNHPGRCLGERLGDVIPGKGSVLSADWRDLGSDPLSGGRSIKGPRHNHGKAGGGGLDGVKLGEVGDSGLESSLDHRGSETRDEIGRWVPISANASVHVGIDVCTGRRHREIGVRTKESL